MIYHCTTQFLNSTFKDDLLYENTWVFIVANGNKKNINVARVHRLFLLRCELNRADNCQFTLTIL